MSKRKNDGQVDWNSLVNSSSQLLELRHDAKYTYEAHDNSIKWYSKLEEFLQIVIGGTTILGVANILFGEESTPLMKNFQSMVGSHSVAIRVLIFSCFVLCSVLLKWYGQKLSRLRESKLRWYELYNDATYLAHSPQYNISVDEFRQQLKILIRTKSRISDIQQTDDWAYNKGAKRLNREFEKSDKEKFDNMYL